jgi:hypothetical protein
MLKHAKRQIKSDLLIGAMLIIICGAAQAAKTVEEAGSYVCVTDKWTKSTKEEGHNVADFAGRCVLIPSDPAAMKIVEDCTGTYEYLPDQSWTGSGTCTQSPKGSEDKRYIKWEQGSELDEPKYTITGGTGQYQGASGGGTTVDQELTDTLSAGTFKGQMELP